LRLLELAKRNLREVYRDRVGLAFLLGMPLVFMLVFGIAFGREYVSTITIGLVQEEQSSYSGISDAFIHYLETLSQIPHQDISQFSVTRYASETQAMDDLKSSKITGFLVIPSGFGEAVAQTQAGQEVKVPLQLTYDETNFLSQSQMVPIITTATLGFLGKDIPLNLEAKGAQIKVEKEFVNFFVPGITVFGLMILVPTLARMLVGDRERGFLSRLLTTPASPADFVLGYSIPFILVMIVQTAIYLTIGLLLGLRIVGNFGLAFAVFFFIGLCCIGIAMIVGTLVKSEAQSQPASWIFLVPLAIISGAWFPVERMHPVLRHIAEVFPFIHAIDASRHVITSGANFSEISTDFYWLVGWTLVLFTTGLIVFRSRMVT
jgi:ABC-2 type transport system permease protein